MAKHWIIHAGFYPSNADCIFLLDVFHRLLHLELADMNKYDTGSSLKIHSPPPVAGGYRMGDDDELGGWVIFNLPKKPRWIHRMGVRLVLGWKWVDA